MPSHVDEYYVFEDFRNLESAGRFVRLFNEHSSMDKTFRTKREIDKFIDNDYSKLEEEEQKIFINDMERALTDLRSGGFERPTEIKEDKGENEEENEGEE